MVSKIALEEHFLCPGFEKYWAAIVSGVAPDALQRITARLPDFGAARIEAMDKAGISKAVLSLAGPGVQVEPDPATAVRMAAGANDYLASELQKRGIVMPASGILRCGMRRLPPMNSSDASAISAFPAR